MSTIINFLADHTALVISTQLVAGAGAVFCGIRGRRRDAA